MHYERPNIRRMQGYLSGEQPDDPDTIKLNTNENPYPPSPKVQAVIQQFSAESFRRYPPPMANSFRDTAAGLHGLSRENIIATRGGDELLRLVITTFVEPGKAIGMTAPTYSLYPVLAQIQNCPTVAIPLQPDWSLPDDFARQMNKKQVKLTLLVNPHAPSGTLLPLEQLTLILDELDSLLLLDEAYIDFVDHAYSTTQLVRRHPNLIILRTLSKGYSLAGLRFGYGIAPPALIDPMLNKTKDSYNLGLLEQKIAECALADQTYAQQNHTRVIAERHRLQTRLATLDFKVAESQANFVLATVTGCPASLMYQKLKDRQILVRYFDSPDLMDKLRITIGLPGENQQLEAAMTEILRAQRQSGKH